METDKYSGREGAWMKAHESALPRIKKDRACGVGTLNDLADITDRYRQGSDVYVGGVFEIVTGHTKMSSMPIIGSPTMPIKQWIRHTPKRNGCAIGEL
jgi:hypothetical protein